MVRRDAGEGRAPNKSSSAYKGTDGYWHGRVSMGVDDLGKPDRRHVMGASRAEVARKVRDLERLASDLENTRSEASSWSRLSESNRRPTHYECVALAD